MRLRNFKILQRLLITTACIGWAGVAMASDADYDNNGVVDEADCELVVAAFGSGEGDADYLAAADHDGDGVIAGADLTYCQSQIGQ